MIWFLVGCGIAVFLFYMGGIIWDIISMSFELIFGSVAPLILGAIIVIAVLVLFVF